MRVRLRYLVVRTRKTIERIDFAEAVTFLHGPVSTGKSTVARLVDYCFGGDLERTPAIQQEFVAAELGVTLGEYHCALERGSEDTQTVRVSWSGDGEQIGSVNAPLLAASKPLVNAEVYNLSDLVFHLCGVTPIRVRQRRRDPESPLIRLSIRDVWRYCYLGQEHLDSSFFRFEDSHRGRKSQDAMRFFTGLHSERLSDLETEVMRISDEQKSKREAATQIRSFMKQFLLGSELDLVAVIQKVEAELATAKRRLIELEHQRTVDTHPTDSLRATLRRLGTEIESLLQAVEESREAIGEQRALRAELITAKVKAERVDQATAILEGVEYQRCPRCGSDISDRAYDEEACRLCQSRPAQSGPASSMELEALRRDLNERIDEIADSVARREWEMNRMLRQLSQARERKATLDAQLQEELRRYDSGYVEAVRGAERQIATLSERLDSVRRLRQMPIAIDRLEEAAGSLAGTVERLRGAIKEERSRFREADSNIAAISAEFKRVMLAVSFPGVSEEDDVIVDPRNWRPTVVHGDQEWSFWDAGSGGKKTLFNVCYALAIHSVALDRRMPVPEILIIDGPTKNISEDENPELVHALYAEIYRLARDPRGRLQFLLIDSDLVGPTVEMIGFSERRMAGEPGAPCLIPYYSGP